MNQGDRRQGEAMHEPAAPASESDDATRSGDTFLLRQGGDHERGDEPRRQDHYDHFAVRPAARCGNQQISSRDVIAIPDLFVPYRSLNGLAQFRVPPRREIRHLERPAQIVHGVAGLGIKGRWRGVVMNWL
jgi:hypothetical protein